MDKNLMEEEFVLTSQSPRDRIPQHLECTWEDHHSKTNKVLLFLSTTLPSKTIFAASVMSSIRDRAEIAFIPTNQRV